MEQSTIRSNRWNEAARYGLVFGAISTAYLFLGRLHIQGILGFIIWAVKFVGCIKLMQYVMKKFASNNPSAIRSDIFKLGMLIAVLSALVYSAAAVADMLYISPEYYQAAYTTIIEQLPAAQVEEFKTMLTNLPEFTFIGTFTYCSLFGVVLSFILSRNIPNQDPFHNLKPDEQ